MDTLRLILLLIGLAIVAGIYWRYREPRTGQDETATVDKPSLIKRVLQRHQAQDNPADDRLIGPEISDEDVASFGHISVQRSEVPEEALNTPMHVEHEWDSMTPVDASDEVIIAFHILAREGESFSGEQITEAAEACGFYYGEMNIFHYYGDTDSNEKLAVCSLANLFKPGHFDLNAETDFTTPGISLFMQLPGPMEARAAFKTTLEKAKSLAEQLDGELCDETRSMLTEQTIGHLKEKVEAFRFKQQIVAMKNRRHER